MYRQPSLACGTEPNAPISTSLPAAPETTRGCHGLNGNAFGAGVAITGLGAGTTCSTGACSASSSEAVDRAARKIAALGIVDEEVLRAAEDQVGTVDPAL